jgi:YesN/AraC family two-component response regulator
MRQPKLKSLKKTIQKILVGLKKFEKEKEFLSQNISLNKLAKKLKTNPKYLSYLINSTMKKNFPTYLNDLRIDYLVVELQINKELKKYTIEAIGENIGYKNSVSFSSAFKNKTGLTPSYFIEQIKKDF